MYHFVNLELGAGIFFEKDGSTKKGGVNSEIVNWGNNSNDNQI